MIKINLKNKLSIYQDFVTPRYQCGLKDFNRAGFKNTAEIFSIVEFFSTSVVTMQLFLEINIFQTVQFQI
jgi:hypothetical protein